MPRRDPFSEFSKQVGFKGFKGFGKAGIPKVPKPVRVQPPDATPDEYDRVLRMVGNATQAKRVYNLQQQNPNATLPEAIVMDWLNRNGERYIYQASAFGGRRRKGGLVPDFVLPRNGLAIQVQGEYWHSVQRKGLADRSVKLKLVGRWASGVKIRNVVEVWENDCYHGKAEQTMRLALAGQGMR